jgi:AcrR family transcriptional regulator
VAARKPREAPEVVKERIEIAAIELFAVRGSDAVSVGQIASAVAMSSQAVLYHYGTKAALHEAVTARILAITGAWLSQFGAPDTLDVSLDGLTQLILDFASDNPWVPIAILRELLRSPDVAQPRFQGGVVRPDLDARTWFDRIALMVLATLSFPQRSFPLEAGSAEEDALRAELRESVRIALTSVFVDPAPWLGGGDV